VDKKKRKRRMLYASVSICVCICFCLLIKHYNNDSKNQIESHLILEKEYLDNKFIEELISTENDLKKYNERYGIDEEILAVNFEEEVVFMCSLHSAKEFYYKEKNTQKNGLKVLDIIFNKDKENKLYVYVLKKVNIITWEAAGNNVEPSFA